mgnify:CR=1 FL=1|jgi:outer membrane protein insertion porin family
MRSRVARGRTGVGALTLFLVLLLALPAGLLAQDNLKVRGMGFWRDRQLQERLAFLNDFPGEGAVELDAAVLEDSAFILLEQVKSLGYQRPKVTADLQTREGPASYDWTHPYQVVLPPGFEAESVVFRIHPRILYFYESVEVKGVTALSSEEAESFFLASSSLFTRKKDRRYTPGNLEQRTRNLLRTLQQQGYAEAALGDRKVEIDRQTGAVEVTLTVNQGPLFRVGKVEVVRESKGGKTTRSEEVENQQVDTDDWLQDFRQQLLNEAYREGYPDAMVRGEVTGRKKTPTGVVVRDYRFEVDRGEQATIAGITFAGDPGVKRRILLRQAGLEPGELLNPIEVAEGRRKLMGLGVFRAVDVAYGKPDADRAREVTYTLPAGLRERLSGMVGWGSYEMARVGLRWERNNPFHRAHRIDLNAKQSLKSSQVRALYAIPQFAGTDITLVGQGDYLYREEIGYERDEAGITLGSTLSPPFVSGLTLDLRYGFQNQRTFRDNDVTFRSRDSAVVASLQANATLNRLDNSLFPTRGYQASVQSKTASRLLGGNVDFEKVEVGGSYHIPLVSSLILHSRLRYGGIFSWQKTEENIPFSERFFLGGSNTLRGYQEGEASPVDSSGERIGAQAYTLGNLEAELRILRAVSLVAFYDAAVMSAEGRLFADGEFFNSAGAGINLRSPVGPVRIEYGYNLNRPPRSPAGTLHFAFGFPF